MNVIEKIWYEQHPLWTLWVPLTLPLALLYRVIIATRAWLVRLFPPPPLAAPVIVVGNLSVGGTGKTPMIIRLAGIFKEHGYKVGIISRGYKARCRGFPHRVMATDSTAFCGDEPKLLAQTTGCPVVIDPKRRQAAQMLIDSEAVDVILSDDGLQHVSLPREMEIAMVNGTRKFGNGLLLPAGPLREPIERLSKVDFVVVNGGGADIKRVGAMQNKVYQAAMHLLGFHNLVTGRRKPVAYFKGHSVHLTVAIAHPQQVVGMLRDVGINPQLHDFPDHYRWQSTDFAYGDNLPIIITGKDAVKCTELSIPAAERMWVIESELRIGTEFENHLMQRFRTHTNGRSSA